jgi:ribosomal protein S2
MLTLLAKQGGHILIINTNPEYFNLTKNLSLLTSQTRQTSPQIFLMYKKYQSLRTNVLSFCSYKWIGGTLTNWKQISRSVLTFAKFSERCEPFLIKNNIDFPRYKKIRTCFEGLIQKQSSHNVLAFYEKPDVIFLVNPNENQNIMQEAAKLHIPIVAFTESNTNIKDIAYPIPLNTYSMTFVYFCLKKIVKLALFKQKYTKSLF